MEDSMSENSIRITGLLHIAKAIFNITQAQGLDYNAPSIEISKLQRWLDDIGTAASQDVSTNQSSTNANRTTEPAKSKAKTIPSSSLFDLSSPYLWQLTEALSLNYLPKHLAIIGCDKTAIELATIYQALGCKVSILVADTVLLSKFDADIDKVFQRYIKRQFKIYTNSDITGVSESNTGILINFTSKGKSQPESCFDAVYLANDTACENVAKQTTRPQPYLINSIPSVAWIGFNETELVNISATQQNPINYQVVNLPWRSIGRANTDINTNGLTKLIFNQDTDELIGAGVMGINAEEIFGELCLAVTQKATAQQISTTVHAHPTLYESILVAAESYLGIATDIINE